MVPRPRSVNRGLEETKRDDARRRTRGWGSGPNGNGGGKIEGRRGHADGCSAAHRACRRLDRIPSWHFLWRISPCPFVREPRLASLICKMHGHFIISRERQKIERERSSSPAKIRGWRIAHRGRTQVKNTKSRNWPDVCGVFARINAS